MGFHNATPTGTYVSQAALGYGTKTAALALSSTNASVTSSVSDWCERFVLRAPVATTQWRLHVRNFDYRSTGAAAVTGAVACVGMAFGTPVYTAGAVSTSAFTEATPAQPLAAFSTPADGSEYVSAWVTDPTMQFAAAKDYLLSFGFTCAGGQTINRDGAGLSFFTSGVGASALFSQQPSVGGSVSLALLDIWIEYQFVGAQKVGLAIGTSIEHGYLTTLGPHDAYPQQWSQRTKTPVVDSAYSGSQTTMFTTSSDGKWSKYSAVTPDFVILNIDTNDVSAGTAAATIQANYGTAIGIIRSKFGATIPIFLATTPPRNLAAAAEAVRVAMNVWKRGLPYGVAGCFSIEKAVQDAPAKIATDGGTTSGSPTVTTTSAALTDVGRPITGAGIPASSYVGAVVVGTSVSLSSSPVANTAVNATATASNVVLTVGGPVALDPEFTNADAIHIKTGGASRMADAVPGRLVSAA